MFMTHVRIISIGKSIGVVVLLPNDIGFNISNIFRQYC